MLHFAYGVNLDPEIMRKRCPKHAYAGVAELKDYRLVFPPFADDHAVSVASVHPSLGSSVWGAVFDLSFADILSLDRAEGYRSRKHVENIYEREIVSVTIRMPSPRFREGECAALIYVARDDAQGPVRSRRALEPLLSGARYHRLPRSYIEQLEQLAPA